MAKPLSQSPRTSFVTRKLDSAGRISYRFHAEAPVAVARFEQKQLSVLFNDGPFLESEPLARLAAYLVLFEGVGTREDLLAALRAALHGYSWRGHACIEWFRPNGYQDRRQLSALTTRLLPLPTEIETTDQALSLAITRMAEHLYPGNRHPLESLFADAQAWTIDRLPGVLAAHITNDVSMCALPKSALVRKQTFLCVAAAEPVASTSVNMAKSACFDRALCAPRLNSDATLLQKIKSIATSASADRQEKLCHLLELSADLKESDQITALVLGWAIELLESGSIEGEPVASSTLRLYIGTIVFPLHQTLKGDFLNAWDEVKFSSSYDFIIYGVTEGQRSIARTALSSWHHYLREWFDVPAVVSFGKELQPSPPKAGVVWRHEKKRVLLWLSTRTNEVDDRLCWQARVALQIAFNARIRIGELLSLRIHSVQELGNKIEIHLKSSPADSSQKSENAIRTVVIANSSACSVIRSWVRRRLDECATGDDYLFGDPLEHRSLYMPGAQRVLMARLLKAATGDRSVCFHTLSHSYVSFAMQQEFFHVAQADINPIEAIARAAGHRSAHTTISVYTNIYEAALARAIDTALRRLPITSKLAARATGVKATTIRKAASRSTQDSQAKYWDFVLRLPPAASHLPPIEAGLVLAEPTAPVWSEATACLDVDLACSILRDARNGLDTRVIALRSNLTESTVQRALREALLLLSQHVERPGWQHRTIPTADVSYAFRKRISELAAFDFKHLGHEKFSGISSRLTRLRRSELYTHFLEMWRRCMDGEYLSLEEDPAADGLLTLLETVGVSPANLAIARVNEPLTVSFAQHSDTLFLCFRRIFGVAPQFLTVQPRRGRPKRYLVWSSSPITPGVHPPPASSSIQAFNVLLLALHVVSQILSTDPTPAMEDSP